MQKVKVIYKEPVAFIENGQAKIKYDVKEETHITASTKSTNNLVDELTKENKKPTDVKVEEIYLDKAKTRQAITELVMSTVADNKIQNSVIEHVMKGLDTACVFKKPPIVRKKA